MILQLRLLLATLLLGLVVMANSAKADDPIVIPIHNWSSQVVGAHIVGKLLNKANFKTEFVPADAKVVFTSMCEGDVHIVHEVWEGASAAVFDKFTEKGCVLDAATHDATTREEWWYPKYVEEEFCPGLPDWKALNECHEKFTTPETSPKGRYLAGPVDWLKHDKERVEALSMNFEVVNAGSASSLWAELKSAHQQKEPIVLFNWTPNFIEALYEGEFVEFPEHDPACTEDASWGMNPDMKYDCGNPKGGYLKIAVWEGFPEKWPRAYKIVQNINFSNHDIAVMAKLADVDGMEPEAAADKWLEDNQDKWQPWLDASS